MVFKLINQCGLGHNLHELIKKFTSLTLVYKFGPHLHFTMKSYEQIQISRFLKSWFFESQFPLVFYGVILNNYLFFSNKENCHKCSGTKNSFIWIERDKEKLPVLYFTILLISYYIQFMARIVNSI